MTTGYCWFHNTFLHSTNKNTHCVVLFAVDGDNDLEADTLTHEAADTTALHGKHAFDENCRICAADKETVEKDLSAAAAKPKKTSKKDKKSSSKDKAEEKSPAKDKKSKEKERDKRKKDKKRRKHESKQSDSGDEKPVARRRLSEHEPGGGGGDVPPPVSTSPVEEAEKDQRRMDLEQQLRMLEEKKRRIDLEEKQKQIMEQRAAETLELAKKSVTTITVPDVDDFDDGHHLSGFAADDLDRYASAQDHASFFPIF